MAYVPWPAHKTTRISGKVTSAENDETLPAVNVVVKGTTIGAVTDMDGNYNIIVTGENATLVFSSIGYITEEETVGGRTTIDVVMTPDLQQLSEIVVTGYGERSKEAFTGAVSTIGADKIENKPFTSVDQVLQGNVAGLQLSATSGTPGSFQNIRIRGISSITAINEPLFVIDGIPVITGENDNSTATGGLSILSSLNNNDVESITVLKDASATALYGARGANGVIIITTKKGKSGKPVISFSAQAGTINRAVPAPKMLNAAQWNELYYESRVNAEDAATIDEAKQLFPSGWDGETDTNWGDVVRNEDAKTQNYDLSVRGGNDKSNYYASLGYSMQDGINIGSDFERYSGKFNYGNAITDKIMLTTATSASYVYQKGQLEGFFYFGNPDASVIFSQPIDPAYNEDGTPNLDLSNSYFNPIYIANNNIWSRKQTRIFNSTSLEYNILEALKFTSTLGLEYINTEELYYDNRHYGDGVASNGYSSAFANRIFNWDWKNMIDYKWRINEDHNVDFKLVYEAQKYQYHTVGSGGYDIAADGLYYPESVGTPDFAQGLITDWAINSVLGVVNYNFKGKMYLDGTFRREGNSRFAPGNRWGSFYSLGASWIFSDEAFMQGASDWLNTSKLRVSYGKTGNAGININSYQAFLNYSGVYNGNAAVSPSQLGNSELTWENSKAWNIGLDFGLLDRITGTVEYFHRKTYDLLLDVPLSNTTGFSSQTQNLGEMVNRG